VSLTRDGIAYRVACDLPEGSYVNLGIGIPTLVSGYIPRTKKCSSTVKTESWAWVRWRSPATKIST